MALDQLSKRLRQQEVELRWIGGSGSRVPDAVYLLPSSLSVLFVIVSTMQQVQVLKVLE